MALTISDFKNVANSTFFSMRDIKLEHQGQNTTARLGNFIFSAGKTANKAVMVAFKTALENEYGALGTHAFDTVLTSRVGLNKSLRACDIKATLSQLQRLRENRFVCEINRQLDTSPKFLRLPEKMQLEIRKNLHGAPFEKCNLAECKTPADVSKMAKARIDKAITKQGGDNMAIFVDIGARQHLEREAAANEATGLRNLKVVLEKGATSIEDQVKKGLVGTGIRINRSNSNPILLDKLKTNGVEPGFIYRNDWSKEDTRGFMAEIAKGTDRAAILAAGRAHPAGVAAAAEFLIQKAAQLIKKAQADGKGLNEMRSSECVKNLAKALANYFSSEDDIDTLAKIQGTRRSLDLLNEAKTELFTEIRDAVMGVKSTDEEYEASPVFKHFAERHIMKLDYNENDRIFLRDAAHAGSFQRPERILTTRKPILAQYYRLDTAQGADDISAGAVTEALANDLTRIAGVPSQELEIVRGEYSDGHPKLMLQAKFAEGYKDMEEGFIKDGRIVKPNGSQQELESLGKYKAFFLLTADRDAVGKRGQNKGFAKGRFFAIDPGHSLEGNGKYLEISDDFSFKDTYGASTKPRFKNFSVFDDDTRFAKLQGLINLRDTAKAGAFKDLFVNYRNAFNPAAEGISPAESAMRTKIIAEINKKEAEFKAQLDKLLNVGAMQLELYDNLAGTGLQEVAIENLANLEKLCSPTTWVSKNGEVPLKHLEVKAEKRIPWRAGVEGDNIVYHTDKAIPAKALEILQNLGSDWGVKAETDGFGITRVVVPKESAAPFFALFNEDKVAELTHPAEHAIRKVGGEGLLEAAQYEPFKAPTDTKPSGSPLAESQLPEELEFEDDTGHIVRMPKIHYEKMATTACSGFHRPRSVDELRAAMKARVHRGNEIYRALLAGNMARFEANEQNVSALAIAMHAAALKKGEMMYRGSFSVADPKGNIARWLDTNKNLYQRTSTHARPYQSLQVDGHLNMPRGFDVREGMGGLLNGMRTFHYFSLPDMKHLNDVDKGSGPDRRLFFKCETFGIYFSTIHAKRSAKADSRVEGMRTRWYEFGDVCESIAHCASLLVSRITSRTNQGIRKEDLPAPVAQAIKEAAEEFTKIGMPQIAERLLVGSVLDGGGVRQFMDNVESLVRELPDEGSLAFMNSISPFLTRIDDALKNLAGNINLRMGNEIMLDAKDFGVEG